MSTRLLAVALVLVLVLAGCGGRAPRSAPSRAPLGMRAAPARPVRTGRLSADGRAVARLARLGRPVYCAGGHRRAVALTFDDGPGPYTHFALSKLRRFHARATFFLVGRNLKRSGRLARAETRFDALGDHTFTHPYLPGLPLPAMRSEIVRAAAAIEAATGERVGLFRPPYGARTPAIDAAARSHGLLTVVWDVDARDSEGANFAQIKAIVRRGLRPGAIVLMHENRGQTIRALAAILYTLHRRHLRAVTLPELMRIDPPSSRQLRAGPKGCPGL